MNLKGTSLLLTKMFLFCFDRVQKKKGDLRRGPSFNQNLNYEKIYVSQISVFIFNYQTNFKEK